MDPSLRSAYNAAYTPEMFRRYLSRLETQLGVTIPFRVAETPLFLPRALRENLATSAREVVAQLCSPEVIAHGEKAVPAELDVPRRDTFSTCVQVDFAITRDPVTGELGGKIVELQGFPSLYALMVVQAAALGEELRHMPGLDRNWTLFFGGHDRTSFLESFRATVLGDCAVEEVVLLDIDPPSQKTYCDFVATKLLLGIDSIDVSSLKREGRVIYREYNGRKVQVRRIFNRVVFDELERKKVALPFSYREDLDVTWVPHPNWYWIWSKYTLPLLAHAAVPKARFVSDVRDIPDDLSRYVLKPLFSYAGSGVNVAVTREDIERVPEAQRAHWLLQEKIDYAPALIAPDGAGVKAEVRMMFLRTARQELPELVLNLVRLSRGALLGVDQNAATEWVGGTVGIWPADET